jgi:hypothetical protein
MRHDAELTSDKFEVRRWMRSQIVGAMERQPGIESCGSSTFAVVVLTGALDRAKD